MADPIAEYTVRDFSAVDRQIEQIAERERVVTQKLRLANLFHLVKFAVIGLIAAGVFFLLLGIAYRIAFPPEQAVIKTKEVVSSKENNTAPQTIVIQTPAGSVITPSSNNGSIVEGASASAPASSSKENSSAPSKAMWGATETSEATNSSTTENKAIKSDEPDKKSSDLSALGKRGVTTFTTVNSNITGFGEVVTGWRWGDVDAKKPGSQYCYVEKSKTQGMWESISIADKLGQNGTLKNSYSSQNARAAGLTKTQWDSILRKCSWFR